MLRCFQYSSAYRSLDEPPDDLTVDEESTLRQLGGGHPVDSLGDDSPSPLGAGSAAAAQQGSLSAQRSSPSPPSPAANLLPVDPNRFSPADLNRLSPLSISSTGTEISSGSQQHLRLNTGGSAIPANLGGHLGGSTGTLSSHLSNLLSPPAPSFGGSLTAGTHSAPGSTAGLTPELKRPPNHKHVKHLEATLLKNSLSDSQLNRRQRDEERYIRVPIGAHSPVASSGAPGVQQIIPPPRPTAPCPNKRDKRPRELIVRPASIGCTTDKRPLRGADDLTGVSSTSSSADSCNSNELKVKNNQREEINMGGAQIVRVCTGSAPRCWAPPIPGERLSVVQERMRDCLSIKIMQQSQEFDQQPRDFQKQQQLSNICNESKTHESRSAFRGLVHLPHLRPHPPPPQQPPQQQQQQSSISLATNCSVRVPILAVGGTNVTQHADVGNSQPTTLSAVTSTSGLASSLSGGGGTTFGADNVSSSGQRQLLAFSAQGSLGQSSRLHPTQGSVGAPKPIQSQDQLSFVVQQRRQVASSTIQQHSTNSCTRNSSGRLFSSTSRKCKMAPPLNLANVLDGPSGPSTGGGTTSAGAGSGATGVSGGGGGGGGSTSSRSWLHQDNEILGQGVCYTVKYAGCLEVLTSMKSLDFETRTLIAKECIVRVSESAGLRTADKKRKIDRRLHRVLAEKPILEHAGANVSLRINSSSLSLTDLESSQPVASHLMPNISFASGGDQDTLDFVAYVGKDARQSRACFVLECGGGLAQEVIATIGQAFDLRFRELMSHSPVVSGSTCAANTGTVSSTTAPSFTPLPPRDPDYYNDLPGKTPPEHHPPSMSNNNVVAGLPASCGASSPNNNNTATKPGGDNLIDFENPDPIPDHHAPPPHHEYVNQSIINNTLDVFDMRPMDQVLSPGTPTLTQQTASQSQIPLIGQQQPRQIPQSAAKRGEEPSTDPSQAPPTEIVASIEQHLLAEPWYHGAISRAESEKLLERDGDFLVRESCGQRGQFVLTGLQAGQGRHLLLIDPHGVVRTKDRTFSSVSHLIHFHRDNQLPILSVDSALLLVRPIMHNKCASSVSSAASVATHSASITSSGGGGGLTSTSHFSQS